MSQPANGAGIDQTSPESRKIGLFRMLFRGREDVYPRRFESRRTGKTGYCPACLNEWVPGLCDKRAVRCAKCPNRRFPSVTDAAIRRHLTGVDEKGRPFVMGVYPMLPDETCWFLAADFDKTSWREDIRLIHETCREQAIPTAIERSRSGNGAHLWLFFDTPIPAILARKLGACILTRTMERRPDIGLDSYDRLFPNQDTLPRGGFGNLIAMPLQRQARLEGNSVFLDEHLEPYADQWAFLSAVQRLSRADAERIVRAAENRHGNVTGVRWSGSDEEDAEPWLERPSRRRRERPIDGPLPERIDLVQGNAIYIPKTGLPPALRNRLLRLAAFQNPEFYRAQAGRRSTKGLPRIIACAEEHPLHIELPRGCLDDVKTLLGNLDLSTRIRDERHPGSTLPLTFHGRLRPDQQVAAQAMAAHDDGVLAATTAFGKTVVAAWLIAQRAVNTLVLVHRRQLMEQWVERLAAFLDIQGTAIGRIGGGHKKVTGTLDVALIQSLIRKGIVSDQVGEYGQLIVDECHILPAPSFEQVARRAKPRFVLGLSATVARKDGHHPVIFMQCGPIRFRVDPRRQAAARPFDHSVIVRPTGFRPPPNPDDDPRIEFHRLYQALIGDETRNPAIVNDVLEVVRERRSPVVLTERTEHLRILQNMLEPHIRHLVVLQGGMGRKAVRAARETLAAIPENEDRVLLATGRYLGEGFDDARLDTLFLTLPVSWRGTVAQYAGRLHRLHEGKREVRIYDYADLNAPMLARMFDRRCRGYEAIGYTILLPASAVPGWPPEIPLPVATEWKRDYAASVQRLICDGVDTRLGNLFVHAARTVQPENEGENRARSASEAFLYRRLQTLPETTNQFRMNATLAIPFDQQGAMEVDFLCDRQRIVIEVDGAQHLNDPQAYRRDRRKDVLLQENGYFLLRFLTEDVGKQLDYVLDTILRAMAHRRIDNR